MPSESLTILKLMNLCFLDIEASRNNRLIDLNFVKNVGEEANMPFAVGGGIRTIEDIKNIINAGAEKVIINSAAAQNPEFIKEAAETFGSSTIVVCIDVKHKLFKGSRTWILGGRQSTLYTPLEFARLMEHKGAGELIIQSIEQDGMMQGYDIKLVKSISTAVSVPVVALGGAGEEEDLIGAYKNGYANGLAGGSIFVYQSKKQGVLINYPDKHKLVFE